MPTVMISPSVDGSVLRQQYRATSDDRESVGGTPGAALDALAAQLGPGSASRIVVVIEPLVDEALTPEQRGRLDELKKMYRSATSGRGQMSPAEREEMELLFDAQFTASERRALALAREQGA